MSILHSAVFITVNVFVSTLSFSQELRTRLGPDVVSRGAHEQRWQNVATVRTNDGRELSITNSYVELKTGANRWDNQTQSWVPASDQIEIINNHAISRQARHKAVFSANLNDPAGTLDFWTAGEEHRLRSQVIGIAYTDRTTGESVFIAEIRDSIGEVADNEVLYPNCFDSIEADVRYRNSLSGLEQDVIFRESLPAPEDYGFDRLNTHLEIWTQFLEAPTPEKRVGHLWRHGEKVDPDEELVFGEMRIVPGKAFSIGEEESGRSVGIGKLWLNIEQMTFLVESLPYVEAENYLAKLPQREQAASDREELKALATKVLGDDKSLTAQNTVRKPLSLKTPERSASTLRLQGPMIAKAAPREERTGFLIDYTILSSTANYTFSSTETYYISGTVNLSGTTTFEGGTVIKYDNTSATKLVILGSAAVKSDTYRPIIMTAKSDNTVGASVQSGTPSGFYANPAIYFNNSGYNYTLSNFRISYAKSGIETYYNSTGNPHIFKHFQLVECERGFTFNYTATKVQNGLLYNVDSSFYYPNQSTNTLENLTIHNDVAAAFQLYPVTSVFNLYNCLLVSVNNMGSWSGLNNVTLSSDVGVFEGVGAGLHYLAAGSPYRNFGTTSIDPVLWAELKKRTTFAPIELTTDITADTVLQPQAARDLDRPDLGYHYPPLDWIAENIAITGATLTLTNGVAIGVYGDTGFKLQAGSEIVGIGNPLSLNRFVRYHTAQEVANTAWNTGTAWTFFKEDLTSGIAPQVNLAFTEMSVLANSGNHFTGGSKISSFALTDCQLLGGNLYVNSAGTSARTTALTNNLFERVNLTFGNGTDTTLTVHGRNNLFFFCSAINLNPSTANGWEWKDNAFQNSTITMSASVLNANGYNAYVNPTTPTRILPSPNPNTDVILTSFSYAPGTLGKFYHSPTTLQNVGSRNADAAGLYHYTTRTTNTREELTQVDIGFHYVALTSGLPTDTDNDGIPNYANVGLVGHWRLDESSGTSVADSSGRNHLGSTVNGPLWTSGTRNGALKLDGVDDQVTIPNTSDLQITGNMTIAFWMQKIGEATGSPRLLGKGSGTIDNYSIWEETGAGRRLRFRQLNSSGGTVVDFYSSTHIGDQYYAQHRPGIHIAYVVSGSTVSLYIDGMLDSTVSRSGVPGTSADPVTLAYAGTGSAFPGKLDDVRIYNVALSQAQVAQLAYLENKAPIVSVWPNQTAILGQNAQGNPEVTLNFSHSYIDDGLPRPSLNSYPYPSSGYNLGFNKLSGPDPVVTFPGIGGWWARFHTPGTYIMRGSVYDMALSGYADVSVTILPQNTQNSPPIVSAGRDQSIVKPTSNTPLVQGLKLTTAQPRNNHSGWLGMRITVGSAPLVVTELARWVVSGNSGAHTVKLVANNGVDVPGGSISINTLNAPAGQFKYGTLPAPVTLAANTSYFLVSQEFNTGDRWLDYDSQLTPTHGAAITSAAYNGGAPPFITPGVSGNCYGPLNLKYVELASTTLEGALTDDGLPLGNALQSQWTMVSGPVGGTVVFSDATSLTPIAYFNQPGRYVLKLTANDAPGSLICGQSGAVCDEVTVRITANARRPKDVMLVADASEWLNGDSVIYAHAWARQLVPFFDPSMDRVGLVVFSAQSWLQHPLSHEYSLVLNASPAWQCCDVIRNDKAIRLAHMELTGPRKNPDADRIIILFSDPYALIEYTNQDLDKQAALAAKGSEITIIPVGLFPNDTPSPNTQVRIDHEVYLKILGSDPTYLPTIKDTQESISEATAEVYAGIVDKLIVDATFDKKRIHIDAGPDRKVSPGGSLALQGSAQGALPITYTWSKIAGPPSGTVNFSPNSTVSANNTVASFGTQEGTYLIRLTATDSSVPPITSSDHLLVHVTTDPIADYVWVAKGSVNNVIDVLGNDPNGTTASINTLVPFATGFGSSKFELLDATGQPVGQGTGAGKMVRYTPDPNLGGFPHQFTYTLTDTKSAELWIMTDLINEPPTAINDDDPLVFSFSPDGQTHSLTTPGQNILANDFDPNGAESLYIATGGSWIKYPFTFESVTQPTKDPGTIGGPLNGTVQIVGPQMLEYTAPPAQQTGYPIFNGSVSLSYTIRDTFDRRSTANVKLYISENANQNRYRARDDFRIILPSETVVYIDVLQNDHDATGALPIEFYSANITAVYLDGSSGSPGFADPSPVINPNTGRKSIKFTVTGVRKAAKLAYKLFNTTRSEHGATVYLGFHSSINNHLPTAEITHVDGQEVDNLNPPIVRRGIVSVAGSASEATLDPGDLIRYRLRATLIKTDQEFDSPIYYGRAFGSLGELDLRNAPDGMYLVHLNVVDDDTDLDSGAEDIHYFWLKSDLKLGRLQFEAIDFDIPVTDLPLIISRAYDSGSPTIGEFGPGWRLSVTGGKLFSQDLLGQHWAATPAGEACDAYSDGRQYVTVEIGQERFQFYPQLNLCTGPIAGSITFMSVAHDSTLTIPNGPGLLTVIDDPTSNDPDHVIIEDLNSEPYNPETYVFTHPNGVQYIFDNGSLVEVIDRNGNRLIIDLQSGGNNSISFVKVDHDGAGAFQPVAKTLSISRDSNGLITAIHSPPTTAAVVLYEYSEQNGENYLARVKRLVENSNPPKYITANYRYMVDDGVTTLESGEVVAHHITKMSDDSGILSRYEYDHKGRLKSSTDGIGNRTSFDYADDTTIFFRPGVSKGRYIVTDALGRKTTYEYDASGNVVLHRDALGNDTTHDYTYNNDRIETDTVNRFAGSLTGSLIEGPIVNSFAYDGNSDVILSSSNSIPGNFTTSSTFNTFGQLESSIDGNGNVTMYAYVTTETGVNYVNAKGKIKTIVFPTEDGVTPTTTYTYPLNQIIEVDPVGNKTTTTLDPNFGYVLTVLNENNVGADLSYVVRTYDVNGRVETERTRRRLPDETNVYEELTKTYSYDSQGRLLSTSLAAQNYTALVGGSATSTPPAVQPENPFPVLGYSSRGQVLTETRSRTRLDGTLDVQVTKSEYDLSGNLLRKYYPDGEFEEWRYTTGNRLDSFLHRGGKVTFYKYDEFGRQIETIHPDNSSTKVSYDEAGRLKDSTDARGNKTSYAYDTAGRRTSLTNAANEVTQYTYDGAGNVRTVTDAANRVTTHFYNKRNQLRRVLYHDQSERSYSYDAAGRKITETDPEGVVTRNGYDGLGRLTTVRLADGMPDGATTTYSYDEAGNLITQIDAKSQATQFRYDAHGRRIKRKLPNGTTWEELTYNQLGFLKERKDFNTAVTKYEYDSMNRLTQKISLVPGWDPVVFKYRPDGQRESMKYPIGAGLGSEMVTYHYDTSGRLAQKTAPQGTIKYSYEDGGALKKIESYHGATPSVRIHYERDPLNRINRVTDTSIGSSLVTSYHYDSVGNLQNYILPNSVRVDLTYDSLNRLETVEHNRTSRLASFDYGISASGVRQALTEYIEGTGWGYRSLLYAYDQQYRLGKETISGYGPVGTITYDTVLGHGDITGYDQVGNRRKRTTTLSPTVASIPTTTYTYNSKDQITNTGETYDNNGNTLTASGVSGTFGYDFDNRLITYSGGAAPVTIVYDGDGNRVRKTVNSTTTHYLVDDRNPTGYAQVLEESSILNGAPDRLYIVGLDLVNQHRKIGSAWETRYFGYDGLGSARFLTDSNGAISDRYAYDAFGTLILSTGSSPNNVLYTGQQWDIDLQMYYLRARYYSPNSGRFLTLDAYEGSQNNPLSLHKYLYAHADPVNKVDPSGNESIGSVLTGISIQIGLRTSQFVAAHPVYTALGGIVASVAFPQLEAIPPGHPSPLDEMGQVGRIIRQGIARGLAKVTMNNNHPLPKFLGGDRIQELIRIPSNVHVAFHKLLHERLQAKGFTLGGLGGSGNSAADWARHFQGNPGSQQKAFEAVLEAARATDVSFGDEIAETGTTMTQAVWKSIVEGKFTAYP